MMQGSQLPCQRRFKVWIVKMGPYIEVSPFEDQVRDLGERVSWFNLNGPAANCLYDPIHVPTVAFLKQIPFEVKKYRNRLNNFSYRRTRPKRMKEVECLEKR